MSGTNISKITKNAGMALKKHSPEILTGIGVVGMMTTVALAVKATPKAAQLIEEERYRQNKELLKEAEENGVEEVKQIDRLSAIDTIKASWKCYIPAAATGAMSIFCIVGASSVSARRNAALAAAYSISESALKEYRDKVVETIGEKKEKNIREAITKDQLEKNPVENHEVILTNKGDTLCYDVLSGRYFRSDMDKLNRSVNEINRLIINDGYVSLNDFYEEIGLEPTKLGYELGWRLDTGTIELEFDAHLATDGTPCLVVDYSSMPQYEYDRWL